MQSWKTLRAYSLSRVSVWIAKTVRVFVRVYRNEPVASLLAHKYSNFRRHFVLTLSTCLFFIRVFY
jgi:hypothetical protein